MLAPHNRENDDAMIQRRDAIEDRNVKNPAHFGENGKKTRYLKRRKQVCRMQEHIPGAVC
jgi:hypothetical protein